MTSGNLRFILTGRALIYCLPVVALAGLLIPLTLGYTNLSILAVYLAVPMLFAPVLYRKYGGDPEIPEHRYTRLFLLLLNVYFAGLLVSIVLLLLSTVRPFSYYVALTVMASSILFEILLFEMTRKRTAFILSQIMLLSLDIIWGVTLKYHYFIGRTDVFTHLKLIESLAEEGHVTDSFGIYEPFPLWHIDVVSLDSILGWNVPLDRLMFMLNGVIFAFLLVLVYFVGKRVFKDTRIALLSSLFVCLNPDFIYYAMSSIPRSVESFLIVLLVLQILEGGNHRRMLIAITTSFVMILYHPASMPFVILVLVSFAAVWRLLDVKTIPQFLTPNYLTIVIAATMMYWMFFADQLFQALVESMISPAPSGVMTTSILLTPFDELFNYLHYTLLLIMLIVGVLWALQSDRVSSLCKVFCLLGLLFVSVSFPGPGLLSNKLAEDLNFARFGEYTFLFISATGALGFFWLYFRWPKRYKAPRILAVTLFAMMALLSISNDFTASDNPLVKRPFYTYYLTQEETLTLYEVADYSDGYVMSDYVTTRYLLSSDLHSKTHILEVDSENAHFLRNSSLDVILVREQELSARPLKLYSSDTSTFVAEPEWDDSLEYYYNDLPLWDSLDKYSRIFDSGQIAAFI